MTQLNGNRLNGNNSNGKQDKVVKLDSQLVPPTKTDHQASTNFNDDEFEQSVVLRQSPIWSRTIMLSLEELDRYLERAYSSGLLFVRIVHGKGTGKLREAVRNALKSSPYVASFEEPKDSEGGAGVTVAKMAK